MNPDPFIEQCRARLVELDGEILAAMNRRDFSTAERLDRYRNDVRQRLREAEKATPGYSEA